MNPSPIEILLERQENLPTLPGIALSILEAVKNKNTNLDEDGFTLGLLHEIGRLSLNRSMPKQYHLVLEAQRDTLCEDDR